MNGRSLFWGPCTKYFCLLGATLRPLSENTSKLSVPIEVSMFFSINPLQYNPNAQWFPFSFPLPLYKPNIMSSILAVMYRE